MGMFKKISETIGWVLAIAVLFYLPTDWIQPYVLPLTFIGVILIVGFAFYTFKKRGLMIFAGFIAATLMSGPTYAATIKLEECGGSYRGGQGVVSAVKDGTVGGNIFTSDFDDKNVLECVQRNIVTLKGPICSAPRKEDSYDNEIRNHSFYVMQNFSRMSANEAHGGSYFKYFTDKLGFTESDIVEVYKCAKDYTDNAAKVDKALESDCPTIGQTMQQGANDCWPCSLVGLFIDAIQTMAGNMYPYVQQVALWVLGMVFLFWIPFRVLKFIGTLGYGDPGEFMTDLLMRFITVIIVAAILHAPIMDFYRIALSPFINMTAALAGKLTEMAITDGHTTFAEQAEKKLGVKMTDSCKACELMNDPEYEFPNKTGTVVVMDAQSVNGLLCMTCRAYRQVMPMIAIGEKMNCYAIVTGYTIPFTSITIPNFIYLYIGYALILMFSILAIIIAFYILDVILRLGFVIVLTPLFIAAWAFPISREYATKAWHMILFCLLQFIGIAVMMALFINICMVMIPGDTTALINYMVNDNVEGIYNVITGMEALPPLAGSGGAIVVGAATGSVALAAAGGALTLLLLFVLIAFVFFAVKMLTATEKVVEALSGIALGIPSISLGALTGMIQEGMKLAGVGTSLASKGGKKLGDKVQDKAKKAQENSKSSSKGSFDVGHEAGKIAGQATDKFGNMGANQAANMVEKTGSTVAKGIETGGQATAGAVDKAGSAVGKGMTSAGHATTKAGGSMISKGAAMSTSGVGAIAGIPMMIAGAAVAAAGVGMTAAGHATTAASKVAAASIKYGSKAAAKTTQAASKVAGKTAQVVGKTASKVGKKVVSKTAEGVVNVGQKIGNKLNDMKEQRKKRKSAKQKYGK